jgi:hypothetical protein
MEGHTMKKITMIVCVLMVVFGAVGMGERAAALSVLTNSAGQKVVDDGAGHYWYWDMTYFTNQDYATQMQNIGDLDYFGSTQWRMATLTDIQALFQASSPGELLGSFQWTLAASSPWGVEGRIDEPVYPADHQVAQVLEWSSGNQVAQTGFHIHDDKSALTIGAWVVTSAAAVIPEPTPLVLMGIGLIGLLALYRKTTQ